MAQFFWLWFDFPEKSPLTPNDSALGDVVDGNAIDVFPGGQVPTRVTREIPHQALLAGGWILLVVKRAHPAGEAAPNNDGGPLRAFGDGENNLCSVGAVLRLSGIEQARRGRRERHLRRPNWLGGILVHGAARGVADRHRIAEEPEAVEKAADVIRILPVISAV